jgi:hypothetical protein
MGRRLMRREVLVAGGAIAGASAVAAEARLLPEDSPYPEPALSFAFQADVLLGPIQELGVIDGMRRRIVPIIGGTVAGPKFNGTVQPGGADWQGVRPGDGLTRVYARYWLKSDDGVAVGVENSGIRRAPAAVMQRLMAGEKVAPSDYYFRAVPFFEVGDGPYRWMNETMFLCVGARRPDRAIILVYAVS